MCNALADVEGKVSFTFDTWTSDAHNSYLSVMAHYIIAHDGRPQAWELKSEQLAFMHFEGAHTGANIANVLIKTIDRYDLRKKVSWFTADNAANNGSTLQEFKL